MLARNQAVRQLSAWIAWRIIPSTVPRWREQQRRTIASGTTRTSTGSWPSLSSPAINPSRHLSIGAKEWRTTSGSPRSRRRLWIRRRLLPVWQLWRASRVLLRQAGGRRNNSCIIYHLKSGVRRRLMQIWSRSRDTAHSCFAEKSQPNSEKRSASRSLLSGSLQRQRKLIRRKRRGIKRHRICRIGRHTLTESLKYQMSGSRSMRGSSESKRSSRFVKSCNFRSRSRRRFWGGRRASMGGSTGYIARRWTGCSNWLMASTTVRAPNQ